jgi:hypothetical protein
MIRLSHLAKQLTEQEFNPESEADVKDLLDDAFDEVLDKLEIKSKGARPVKVQQEAVGFAIAGFIASLPGLVEFLGKSVNFLVKAVTYFSSVTFGLTDYDTSRTVKSTKIGDLLVKLGHKWEKRYIESIAGWLKASAPSKYKDQDLNDKTTDLYSHCHIVYAALLASLAIKSGIDTAKAINMATKIGEGTATAFKAKEVKTLVSRITAIKAVT